jgi:hypothetical protein
VALARQRQRVTVGSHTHPDTIAAAGTIVISRSRLRFGDQIV